MKQSTTLTAPVKSYAFLKWMLPVLGLIILAVILIYFNRQKSSGPGGSSPSATASTEPTPAPEIKPDVNQLALYQEKMTLMINGDTSGRWKLSEKVPPMGAILPYRRIIAFYGNLYSTRMGILGELPRKEMLEKLKEQMDEWRKADSTIEVIPALHYIAVTAQGSPGKGGKYRLRMPFHQIDSVLSMAKEINALVFIDIQVALSTLESEIPELEEYLKLPNVHLGIDPEFSMKGGERPGTVIGKYDAADINYATGYLAGLVKKYNLPPKILVVHRFTQGMVTNYKKINIQPEVQLVMHMDGWGEPARKINTYQQYIYKEPVEYTGFKVFYKNDTKNNGRILTPAELLKLKPQPLYIQYQ